MKTLIVDTFNGEGYSEPTVKVSGLRNSTETLEIISEMQSSYGSEYTQEQTDGENGEVFISFDDGEDQGAIHIMDLPTPEFYIVQINPQINGVQFYATMPTKAKALETLDNIVNSPSYGWDEFDLEEYEKGNDFFGAHGDDEFMYFQIVQG